MLKVAHEIELIIMGTYEGSGEVDDVMEMVSVNTLERALCSVLLVPKKIVDQKIQTIAYAADLNEADPYYIWRTAKLFSSFSPSMHIVHIEKDAAKERILNMQELQEFFEKAPSGVSTNFHKLSARSRKEELKDFEEEWKVDLLVMSKPKRGFFEGLFHRSVTKQMVFNTVVPLLVMKVA